MEEDMTSDDETQRRARQDLLEALTSGMAGPVIAPMPGVLLELYEIAAAERELRRDDPLPDQPLTQGTNDRRIGTVFSLIGRAFTHVGDRFGKHPDPRGLSA
jgi:hypothetical protein